MALAYAKVLVHLDKEFTVIGRGKASAETFYSAIGVQPITGGIEKYSTVQNILKQPSIIPSVALQNERLLEQIGIGKDKQKEISNSIDKANKLI